MGEDDVEKDIKKAMAGTSPAAAPVPTSAPTDSVEADIQKAMRPSAGQGEQVANPYYEIGKKKPSEIDDVDRDIISTAKTPDQIKQIPKHLPLTEDQLRTKFEHERSLPWNEGMKTPEDWYNIGKDIVGSGVSFVKGAKKFAENTFFSGADEDPSGWGNLSAQPLKDVVSTAVQLPEDVAYAATKLNEGGMGWTDRLSEKLGFHDKEKSYENYKARHLVDQVHAQAEMENPSIYGRIMKGDIANAALSAVVLNSLPDLQTIMEQDGLSLDQAKAKRKAMADQIAQQTTSEIAAQEKPADEDIRTLGQFALPSGLGLGEMGVLGLGAEAAGGLSQQIAKGLKYIGKTDDEIKAMNDAAQALQRSKQVEKIQRAQQPTLAGRAAGTLASGVEKLQQAAENAPQILKTIAPYAIGGALGYETDQQNPLLGAFIGAGIGHGAVPVFKAAANIAKIPALIRDIDEARALSAGGTRGTFETLGSFPDVSEQTAKILRFGGKRLDNIINNSVDYAKSGIHPTLLAVATGALDSADPEQMNQLVSQGLLYGLGGRAVHQAWGKIGGVDPIAEQRERRAQAVDDFKTYQNLDPESQKTLTGLTSWDNVVERHEGRLLDAQNAYSEAVRTGSADAQKLGQDVIAQKNVLSAVKRANVQTRNEFGRQFLTQLTRLNELTNGTLRAGQNNVGIHILTPDQIFAKFRQDPANNGMSDADIMETANQQGFYSTPEGAVEYQAGMPMGGVKKTLIFDRTKPSIVINANHLKARQQIFGETPTEALTHEFGHHIRNIPEFKEANKEAEDLLFSQEIKDLTGKVVTTTSGQYSQKALVDMYTNNYMKGKTPDQIEQLSKLAGLWDASRGQLDEQAVANYMRDEIVAELNADTLSSHLGTDLDSGSLRMLDVARLKTKKNLLDRAVQKFLGNGGKGDPVSELTGATFSPEVVAANRQAMRALQALQGEVSPAVKAPDAPKISRAMMMKNRALQEVYGKYSGLFKTEMVGQMFDAAGNPVGGQVKITNPSASEGVWAEDRQMSGYGQKPDELSTAPIPAGGRLVVSKEIVRQPDGVTPVMYSPSELKKLQIARKDTIMQALDTPDHGTPNRFQPVSDGSQTWRGTFTPLQIEAIKNLPESIVSRSIKEHILKIHDALQRGDGSRMIVDYAAVMNDAGKYTAYSPKHYDVVPIGMHLSKDGHFLVTTISVGRLFDKLNAWSQRMPARLAPWKGDKDAFFKEFTEKYLKNWQYREKDAQGNEMYPQGRAGEYGLSGTPEEALAKKKIFNDFLNLTTNEFRDRNDDRTTTPRRRGDVRGKDIDRTIMSMRLDHIADLIDNEYAPKVPVNYGNAIKNFLPDVAVVPERFFGTGQEPVTTNEEYKKTKFIPEGGRRSKYVTPPSVFSNYDIGQFEKGGKFFDRETGEDVTGKTYSGGAIDVSSGTPSFTTGEESDAIQGTGNKVLTNLFKQKAGWKWASENPPPTKTLVSVEGREGHYYSLRTELPNGVNLTRNPETGEPRLRPSSVGKINLGQEIGRINIRGREHPVYDKIVVGGQPAAPTGIRFMPASAEIREEGTKQHLEFFDRELENSGIKQKPATMAALDEFIHKHVGEKYGAYVYGGAPPKGELFPKIDPEKIKNYYQKVVRNATPAQAADFPPDWLRYRNMSQQEFDRSFEQDKVDQITQFRVNALAKSANYLLGEMKEPKQTNLQKKINEINDALASGDIGLWEEKQAELEKLNGDTYENLRNQAFQGSYTPAEVAAILNTSAKFRVNAGFNENGEMVPLIQNISNGNEAVPNEVSGETASKIAGYMRNGMSSKDAYAKGVFDVIKARAAKRGVYTGWKKYDQSSDMGDAETLNADCAGTGWCTGGEVGTANSHLTGGDFYLYFDEGQPQVAIRTNDGEIVEVRGRGPSQNITKPEYDKKAEEFILGKEGPTGGSEYLHDRNFRKMAVEYMQTGVLPEAAYKYYDQDGTFIEPKPKMSYSHVFETEYTEPFLTAQLGEILDSEGNLKTSLRYNPRDPKNVNYKTIGGDIIGPKVLQLSGYDASLPNLEKINGGIVMNSADTLNLPKLKSVDYIYAKNAIDVDIKNLESCKSIQLDQASKLIIPKLKEIERIIHADEATVIDLRSLTKAKGLRFAQLMDEAKKIDLRNLEECPSIEINIGYGGSLDLPELKKSDSFHVKTFSAGVNALSGEVYVPKLEKPERTLIQTSVLKSTKDVFLAMATDRNMPRPEKFTWINSETGKTYQMKSAADFMDVSRAFLGQPIHTFDGIVSPEELLKFYEVDTQSSRDRAQGVQFMPSRDGEEERITAATYTNPRTGKVTEGATHLIANPSAPQEATDRESPAYGFKTTSGDIVDRATAYQIAKDSGQLKAPTTEEEKFHADRGILHSGMYEPKGNINFMPASKQDEAYDAAVKAGDEAYDPTKENGGVDGLRVKIKEFAESLPDPKSDEIKFHYEKDGIYGLVDNFFRKAFEMLDAKYDEHRASTGSTYIHISIPKAEGDTLENTQELDRENHKITIRDHDVSVFRAREFGSPTKTIKVDNFDTKENVLSAATRLSEHLSNIIEPYREYLSEKANPNAARDEAYDAAVKAGDMEEAQRLVDEAAKEAGNWIPAYHVSQSTDIKVPSGNRGVAAHVTFSKTLADQLSVRDGENPKIYNWYVKGDIFDPENPNHIKRLEDAESNWPLTAPYPEQIQHSGTWKQLENPALQSIIKKAGFDGYYDRSNVGSSWKDSAAIFDANNIKSADPATYDNEGKLIPLSQRFDTTKGDIRFMPDSELPKTEDGKVDWEGFKTRTQETAKPLAGVAPIGGISFKPAQEIELDKPDAVQKAGVATKLPKKVPESGHYTIAMQPTDDGREVQYQVDPASTITPKVGSIEDIDGEQVGILEADRHTTRGDNMGGPLHPFLISNQVIARLLDGRGFKPVWANMNSAFVTRAKNIITNTTNGRALIQIMKEQAHKSNRKFVQDIMQEIDATKKNLSADEKDALHVILELGAKNPAKHLARVTKAAKLLKDGEITQSEFEMIKSQNADKIEKYGPQVEFLKKLGTMKSMATKGNRAGFDKAFKDHNDQFKNEDWYKKIVNKYKNTTFQDEASRFTFVERGAAMSRLDGIAFAPPISQRLADVMDFRGGKNLDLVASVQLSKDPDAFAIYTGKDPKQEAKMSKNERILRDQFMKDPNFRKHPSYDWMMLGPENADNFILEKPVDPMSLFPDYAKNHPKESVRNGSKETIVGTMKKSKIPLIIKTKK